MTFLRSSSTEACLLSAVEKEFIRKGVEQNIRQDGRSRLERRSLQMATGTLTQAASSASVLLDTTALLVGIHTKIDTPRSEQPNLGLLSLSIDCSPSSVSFEREDARAFKSELECSVHKLLELFDRQQLMIIPGQFCWLLHVDVLVLHDGGNLLEAIAQGIRAALQTLALPKVLSVPSATMSDEDAAEEEAGILLSDDPEEAWHLNVKGFPDLKTILQLGEHFVMDPTREEELSCDSAFYLSVCSEGDDGGIGSFRKSGKGLLRRTDFYALLKTAVIES